MHQRFDELKTEVEIEAKNEERSLTWWHSRACDVVQTTRCTNPAATGVRPENAPKERGGGERDEGLQRSPTWRMAPLERSRSAMSSSENLCDTTGRCTLQERRESCSVR